MCIVTPPQSRNLASTWSRRLSCSARASARSAANPLIKIINIVALLLVPPL
jgi:hypothetical protein